MPKYDEFKTYLEAHGEWNAPGVDIVWCGDAFIVHVFDQFGKIWQPKYASKSTRKVYAFVGRYLDK